MTKYSAAIIGASVHGGKHEPEMIRFVKRYLGQLQQIPTLFLSVSLSEATVEDAKATPERRAEAQADVKRMIDLFLAETGWRPSHIAPVGGALVYSRYNFLIRLMMKLMAKKAGAPVDTSRDYEFTDWTKLDRLVDEVIESRAFSEASGD